MHVHTLHVYLLNIVFMPIKYCVHLGALCLCNFAKVFYSILLWISENLEILTDYLSEKFIQWSLTKCAANCFVITVIFIWLTIKYQTYSNSIPLVVTCKIIFGQLPKCMQFVSAGPWCQNMKIQDLGDDWFVLTTTSLELSLSLLFTDESVILIYWCSIQLTS